MQGAIAGFPSRPARTLFDGSYHPVDSSEMAFKLAASMALEGGDVQRLAGLLEPVMLLTLCPEEFLGDVISDLNTRRGRVQGMDSVGGGLSEVKARRRWRRCTYAPDLRSLTGGRGYTMDFDRYEEVPAHLPQKVVAEATAEEAVSA